MEKQLFADVILPLAVSNLFTYSIPVNFSSQIKPGLRVVVQFGKKKLYTALVYRVHTEKPQLYKAKPIESILDAEPVVNNKQFLLWKWIADYYMCSMGEVMNAALPSGLKLSSETKISLNPECRDTEELSDDEYLIYDALVKNTVLLVKEAEKIIPGNKIHAVIKFLFEKRVIIVYEELKQNFKPKLADFIKLTNEFDSEDELKKMFEQLEKKAFKQLEVLMAYIRLSDRYGKRKEVKKSDLIKISDATTSVVTGLVKKGIFEVYSKEVGRIESDDKSSLFKPLSPEQTIALEKIKKEWEQKEVVLLHGITSSGKTEIYVQLIAETLAQNKQVLYLLPEIALTTQIINRIRKYFGDQIGVSHSRFNENERVEVWNGVNKFSISNSKFKIILGARSALFLPYSNIGLIIVDEEHDGSYKQFDPAPRYNARDAAIILAQLHHAKVLLGSATPSVESYYNTVSGKYGLAELHTRYGNIQLPEIIIADIKEDTQRRRMKSIFSPLLIDQIKQAIENKEQVILFQNRRGFAPMLECKDCGWVPVCKNCDVSLVYHKTGAHLRCHYCGYIAGMPSSCSACGSTSLQTKSFGTEKIEEELQVFFPEAKIARMDYDSTRSRFAYEQLINNFEERKIDVLVGTQMVTKGLDFENVSMVGILNADQMMHFPDFRSHERSFQLMAQVAGRAGRKNKRGRVVIQTYSPKHPVIQHVVQNDYYGMYTEEIEHRKIFHYPPLYRIIELTILNKNADRVDIAASELARKLKDFFGNRILGPEFPVIPRIKNFYHKKILIKVAKEESVNKVKEGIRSTIAMFQDHPAFKSGKIQINVDPL